MYVTGPPRSGGNRSTRTPIVATTAPNTAPSASARQRRVSPRWARPRPRARANASEIAASADLGRAGLRGAELHVYAVEEVPHGLGRRAVAVAQLVAERGEVVEIRERCAPAICLALALAARDVVVRDRRREGEVDRDLGQHGLPRRPPLLVHGLLEELRVELESDGGHVAVLLGAEDVPRPADLEVVHRDLESGAELARLEHGLETLARVLGQVLVARVEEVGVRLLGAPPHAAAQLVELREPELARAVDDDRVHARDVEAGLDDRRADQHVVLGVRELHHDALEPAFVHLPVRDDEPGVRNELPQAVRLLLDALDAVVDVVDLAAAVELAEDRLPEDVVGPFDDVRFDRLAVLGRRLDDADVADT